MDLYWIPLGAGGRSVRLNGKVFEAVVARAEHRPRRDIYHAALVVDVPEGTYAVEVGPVLPRGRRGAVARGGVGSRLLGWSAAFRYEVRCWCGGTIPDLGEAVESARRGPRRRRMRDAGGDVAPGQRRGGRARAGGGRRGPGGAS